MDVRVFCALNRDGRVLFDVSTDQPATLSAAIRIRMSVGNSFAPETRTLGQWMLPIVPLVGVTVACVAYANGLPYPASACAAIAVTCAGWWIFESLHIAIVGLLPMAALPALGVLDHERVAASYGHTMIWLLMGGCFLSVAMERSNAHRRIALGMVRAVGGRGGRRLVLGFMLATATLSMWISNSATTLMMLPIAMAVLSQTKDDSLRTPLLLAIAYSASVGGMATPIGTPPNLVFMGIIEEQFGIEVSFFRWMTFGVPVVIAMLPIIWWWLTRNLDDDGSVTMPEVGPWTSAERRVFVVFTLTALAWIFRSGPAGGWSSWFGLGDMVGDTTVALVATMALFLMPAGCELPGSAEHATPKSVQPPVVSPTNSLRARRGTPRLLDWESARTIPWGILLMFGGGLALGSGFQQTGLSEAIGSQLDFLSGRPTWVVVGVVCVAMNFMTEITSSTATATLMMPILGVLATAAEIPPEWLLMPATVSASCAFMLPVATAPNVIVFGAGGLRTDEMARNGLVLNMIAAVVILAVAKWTFGF